MRSAIFVLFLLSGSAAFSQAPTPGNPFRPHQNPPTFTWPGNDFSKQPPAWNGTSIPTEPAIVPLRGGPARDLDRSGIDSQMIIHPPKSSHGAEQQGTFVAQNLYPGLRFLPVDTVQDNGALPRFDGSVRRIEVPASPWPKLKKQLIPITWPNFKLLPIKQKASSQPQDPAK